MKDAEDFHLIVLLGEHTTPAQPTGVCARCGGPIYARRKDARLCSRPACARHRGQPLTGSGARDRVPDPA